MNVYETLRVSRYLPKLAGSAPYRLTGASIEYSRFGQIWPFIKLPIVATLLYIYRDKVPREFGEIKTFLTTITTWLQYLIATLGILKDAFHQRAILEVVRSIDDYDKDTGYENDRNDKRVRFWSFVYSFGLVVLAIARFVAWEILNLDPASEIFIMEIDNSIFMFGFFTILLGLRLRHLNWTLDQADEGDIGITSPEYARQLLTRLVAIGQKLDDHYSARLFLWPCLTTLVLITRFYYILTVRVTPIFVIATIVRLLPSIIGFLFFSVACQFTVQQINRTPGILLEKNIRQTALIDRGRKEIFTIALYMGLRPFQFSALGFFTVDVTLVSAVATITVTYLTLCLQTSAPQSLS